MVDASETLDEDDQNIIPLLEGKKAIILLNKSDVYKRQGYPEQLAEKVTGFEKEIQKLLATADNGRLMKEGISTVIVGKPNAGKSSLLNMLLGEDRAIVTEIAGTTRDALHETINLHGISLNMIDTAGIHETQDVVEKIGVERAKKYAVEADLILYVVDA